MRFPSRILRAELQLKEPLQDHRKYGSVEQRAQHSDECVYMKLQLKVLFECMVHLQTMTIRFELEIYLY